MSRPTHTPGRPTSSWFLDTPSPSEGWINLGGIPTPVPTPPPPPPPLPVPVPNILNHPVFRSAPASASDGPPRPPPRPLTSRRSVIDASVLMPDPLDHPIFRSSSPPTGPVPHPPRQGPGVAHASKRYGTVYADSASGGGPGVMPPKLPPLGISTQARPESAEDDHHPAPPSRVADHAEMMAPGPAQSQSPTPAVHQPHRSLESGEVSLGRYSSGDGSHAASRLSANVFIVSYLIFFSILGTLARLGLQGLTTYPRSPVSFDSLWPNFTGTLILGLLHEGAELLHHPRAARSIARPTSTDYSRRYTTRHPSTIRSTIRSSEFSILKDYNKEAAAAAAAPADPVPLHIGLTTGFCGSLTTFSSFMRDCFVGLAGGATVTATTPSPGQDFMSLAAVVLVTVGVCAAGLQAGAHAAVLLRRLDRRVPRRVMRALDYAVVVLAAGVWAGAVALAAVPPDRPGGPVGANATWAQATWRGQVLFALALAPTGCLLRFLLSVQLNGRFVGFPLGTFCANMVGTLVLAVVWDLQRLPATASWIGRDVLSCQVLQGVADGFCGCLTTVSSWVLELTALRRAHAWRYGWVSLLTAIAIVVIVMGSIVWANGTVEPVCTSIDGR